MRKSRLNNEQVTLMAQGYRHCATEEQRMSWPENSEQYVQTNTDMAEVLEELLDRRKAAGE